MSWIDSLGGQVVDGVVDHFGDPAAELEALRAGNAVVPVTWTSLVRITGRDAVRFLHNFCTADIYKLATGQDGQALGKRPKIERLQIPPSEGRGCMAATVTKQGKLVAAFEATLWWDGTILLLADRASTPGLLTFLRQSVITESVAIDDITAEYAHIYTVRPGHPGSHFFGGWHGEDIHWNDPLPASHGISFFAQQLADGRRPAGFAAWNALRITNGWPLWSLDMDGTMLPMEAGLDPIAISYTKGCYLGQEVIQRVKTYAEPPRELKQLHFTGAAPRVRTPVTSRGESVGETRSAHGSIALALMKKSHAPSGTLVDGATVRDLPWHSNS